MTDYTKGWRAEMPKIGAPCVGFHSSDVSAIVARANAELEARDERIAELEEENSYLSKKLGLQQSEVLFGDEDEGP